MAYVNPYQRTVWKDESDEFEGRYIETMNGDGTITHTPVRGEVYVEGTPMDALHFNNMEEGIVAAHQELGNQDERISGQEQQTSQELHTVTLTNSQQFPFNNSAQSVALDTERDNIYYIVQIIDVSSSGNVGEVEVTDRQVNGFKLGYTGSAPSATITYIVIGGFD